MRRSFILAAMLFGASIVPAFAWQSEPDLTQNDPTSTADYCIGLFSNEIDAVQRMMHNAAAGSQAYDTLMDMVTMDQRKREIYTTYINAAGVQSFPPDSGIVVEMREAQQQGYAEGGDCRETLLDYSAGKIKSLSVQVQVECYRMRQCRDMNRMTQFLYRAN